MTTILSWNIQYGKGCDGLTDPARIRREIGRIGLADVICLQEVSDGFADLDGGADQVAVFAGLFDGYHPVFAPGIDRSGSDGRRQRFGNMVLSRLPVLETEIHLLPRPADPSVRHMRRVAVAVTVDSAAGPLRIATTHLEFFAAGQRRTQVQQIRSLSAEWLDNAARPPQPGRNTYAAPPPAAGLVWCGDFNLVPADPEYAALLAPLPGKPAVCRMPGPCCGARHRICRPAASTMPPSGRRAPMPATSFSFLRLCRITSLPSTPIPTPPPPITSPCGSRLRTALRAE